MLLMNVVSGDRDMCVVTSKVQSIRGESRTFARFAVSQDVNALNIFQEWQCHASPCLAKYGNFRQR